ncbi:hypothetical protein H310_10783 [Aphanomyces invadans]|uniref:Glycoside hydrolase family 5 domain-containing protein n=1 Tax=Aphanomyces invadans TaxID=157072 RepID=A0A024TR93_9STRA|nr:hypothetical protein H310_10783 [Aphanomyces invadans]ETV96151.1 hypothetical protein H310_10783 [Aphanomyces invadans]|eukprot:XP_008875462.1 hypothetical protein H310_10783 [Aphanomyces invadans]
MVCSRDGVQGGPMAPSSPRPFNEEQRTPHAHPNEYMAMAAPTHGDYEGPAHSPNTGRRKLLLLGLGIVVVAGATIGIWRAAKSASTPLSANAIQKPTTVTAAPTPAPTRQVFTIGKIQDGAIRPTDEETNPLTYSGQRCYLPNYISKKGQIFAVTKTNEEIPVAIKGTNWFGMETESAIPFGLWTNDQNGTTLFEIAAFLQRHQFNSVRLPLTVSSILNNTAPNRGMVHEEANAAMDLTNYTSTIGSVVQGLGFRGISVLLDIHNLDLYTKGDAWYGNMTSEADTLNAVDVLTTTLCHDKFWNIVGIDLKNEPFNITWGDSGPKDFRVGAAKMANRMLAKCPQWLAFVEGNALKQSGTYAGQKSWFYDWWGGGLRDVGKAPLELTTANKVVYAPHYYSPSVYPQDYLVQGGKRVGDVLVGYKEWDDATLEKIVADTSEDMFGYLRSKQGGALVLGEFGGLFKHDAHANKTNQRVTQTVINMIATQPGYAGGYVWSLNPESGYEYSSSGTKGYFMEGLLDLDWVLVNMPLLKALEGMNRLNNLKPFPCLAADTAITNSSTR